MPWSQFLKTSTINFILLFFSKISRPGPSKLCISSLIFLIERKSFIFLTSCSYLQSRWRHVPAPCLDCMCTPICTCLPDNEAVWDFVSNLTHLMHMNMASVKWTSWHLIPACHLACCLFCHLARLTEFSAKTFKSAVLIGLFMKHILFHSWVLC